MVIDGVSGVLSPGMLDLVRVVASPLGEAAEVVLDQARFARITSWSSTSVDLEVPEAVARVGLPDGPTPGRAMVYESGELVREVMLWIRDGRLLGLEQPWYTDNLPTTWPAAAQIRLEPDRTF